MSRYNIAPREDENLTITIGWDAPLNTFFAHVVRPGPPDDFEVEDEFVLMVGNRLNEISSVNDLANYISPFGDIPYNVKKSLESDRTQPYERSAFQDWMIKQGLVR